MTLLVAIIILALVFDYINGFHDAANAIATVVSTGVLPVRTAVMIAGVLNFAGAITGTAVAKTISKGLIDPSVVTPTLLCAALTGAITWNLITWWLGLPSSSSHALLGGFAGAALAKAGPGAIIVAGWIKPILGIVVAWALARFFGSTDWALDVALTVDVPVVLASIVLGVLVPEEYGGAGLTYRFEFDVFD